VIPFKGKPRDEGDTFVALTDLSLTTLMMFVLFFLVIFLASFSEDLPQWAERVETLRKLSREEVILKDRVENIKEKIIEGRVQIIAQGMEQAKTQGENLQGEDHDMRNRNLTISMLTSLTQLKLEEGQLIEGLDENRSDESALNELYRQMKQEVHSLKRSVENPYLNTSETTPYWRIKVKKKQMRVFFSFGYDSSRWYDQKEMTKILASLNPGDGIKIIADGWEELGNYPQAMVLGLFEQHGWPPFAIQNLGSREAMLRLFRAD